MKLIYLALLAGLVLFGCQTAADLPVTPTAPTLVQATATDIPTPVPSPFPTATPTVADLIHPYTIDGLRHHNYQSGTIQIQALLEKTDVYTRYLIAYPSDGLKITGIMQVPTQGQPPYPVIIMDHGYFARASYASGDGTWRAAEYLNKYGYLTLASDYRSWGGSDSGPSLYYSGLVIDVENLIGAISTLPQADPNRIGIWGHSMGGGVTLRILEIDPRVRAGVLYSTVSGSDADILARWGPGCIGDIASGELRLGCNSSDVLPQDMPADLVQAYLASTKDPELLKQISPIYHLDLINAPVEISYGTKDGQTLSGTPPEWSIDLNRAFLLAGKQTHLYAYEGEVHSFNGDAWLAFMDRSKQLFDQYVKNIP